MVRNRSLWSVFGIAFALLTTAGNVFALQYKMATSFYVNSSQVQDTFTVETTGIYNIWVPTYTSSYPMNSVDFPDSILRRDFHYKYSFESDLSDSQIAAPFFPKIRGKLWHAWSRLDTITLTASVPYTLTFLADATIDSSDLPARVFITKTDYCPPDSLMGSIADKWIEAEDADSHNFVANPNMYSDAYAPYGILNDPTKFGYGGGKVLRLNDTLLPARGYYFATYSFSIDSAGYYDFWYHGFTPNGKAWWASKPHSPFWWKIDNDSTNGANWVPTSSNPDEGRPDIYSSQSYGWYWLTRSAVTEDSIYLSSGNHTLTIRINASVIGSVDTVYEQMLDVFYFIKRGDTLGTQKKVPCDITASSEYLARLGGMDETNVLYPLEDTVKVALDRRLFEADSIDTIQVKYTIINYYGNVDSITDYLYFQVGNITSAVAISPSLYNETGHYHMLAEFYNGQDTIAYLDTYFGVVYETRFPGKRDSSIFGAAQDAVLYKHLKKAGVKWVRSAQAEWPWIQPNNDSSYEWDALDREIGKLYGDSMNIVCCVQKSAWWASTAPWTPTPDSSSSFVYPPQTDKWETFFATVINRYNDKVKKWELWNEPWEYGYNWKGSIVEYNSLAQHASDILDTNGRLGVYALDDYNSKPYDASVYHIYTRHDDAPEGGYSNYYLPLIKSRNSENKPVWITEQNFGATGQYEQADLALWYTDPKKFADWLVRGYALSIAGGLEHCFIFDFDDWCLGQDGRGSGLINADATPRPGYIAHCIMTYFMEGARYDTTVNIGSKRWAYVFENTGGIQEDYPKATAVVWCTNGRTDTVEIDTVKEIAVFNIMGDTVGGINGDKYRFALSSSPVYIRVDSLAQLKTALAGLVTIDSVNTTIMHTIEAIAYSNGSISPSGIDTTILDEDMPTYTITPASGYGLDSLVITGVVPHETDTTKPNTQNGKLTTYTFSPVVIDQTIKAYFGPLYTITATAVDSLYGHVSFNANGPFKDSDTAEVGSNGYVTVNMSTIAEYVTSTVIDNGDTQSCVIDAYSIYNIDTTHTVEVHFKRGGYVIAITGDTHGSISPDPHRKAIDWGANDTINIIPDTGYCISAITDYGDTVANANPYVLSEVTTNHYIVISFKSGYNINASVSGGHGSVTPYLGVDPNANAIIDITPDQGYYLESIVDNNDTVTITDTTHYQINNVTEDHNVVVTFAPYKIVTVAARDTNGHVSFNINGNFDIQDSVACQFKYNEYAIIKIWPNENYVASNIFNNNDTIVAINNDYVIYNIQEDHHVGITFKPGAYVIATLDSFGSCHGTLSPNPCQKAVDWGANDTITIIPDSGYCIESITDNDTLRTITNPYINYNVTAYHYVVVKLKEGYTVNATSTDTSRGTISPTMHTIPYGQPSNAMTITPKDGYSLATITDNDSLKSLANPYQIASVTKNHTVVVSFIPKYAVTATSSDTCRGTVSPQSLSVDSNATSGAMSISPKTGYALASIIDNGESVPLANPYKIYNTDTAHTVVMNFIPKYTVTATSSDTCRGTVSPQSLSVDSNATSGAMSISPKTGYALASIIDNGESVPLANPYKIYNTDTAHTVVMNFIPKYTVTAISMDTNRGTVSPASQSVDSAATSSGITYTPFSGYTIDYITDNGDTVAVSNPYTIANVTVAHEMKYYFKPQ